jgi:hypothetical protein
VKTIQEGFGVVPGLILIKQRNGRLPQTSV